MSTEILTLENCLFFIKEHPTDLQVGDFVTINTRTNTICFSREGGTIYVDRGTGLDSKIYTGLLVYDKLCTTIKEITGFIASEESNGGDNIIFKLIGKCTE